MNKKLIRICAGALASMLLLTACKKEQTAPTEPTVAPENPVEDYIAHLATGTLHQVQVSESTRPFVVDGRSDYQVIVAEGEANQVAADFIVRYVEMATGCRLSYAEQAQYTPGGKFIVVNDPVLFGDASLSMPQAELGNTGYYTKTSGDSVFLMSK